MATDWDAVSTAVYDLLGMGSDTNKGQVWEAWKHAKQTDHDEWHDDCWNYTNDDEMWAYYDDQVEGAEDAYKRIMAAWSKIYNDRKYLTATGQKGEDWEDKVVEPIRNESYVLQTDTRVKESWYGPSADKYNTALQTQAAAIDEWYQITSTLATSMGTTNDVLKGIMLAVKDSFKPVKDKLNGAEHDTKWYHLTYDGGTYFENVTYGCTQFKSLADWLEDLVESGDWIDTMDDVKMKLEDAKIRTASFRDGWPKATTGKMEDMNNGHQEQPGGPGDEGQPNQQPTEQEGPDVDADADPTQGPGAHEQKTYHGGVDHSADERDEVNPNEK